MVIDVALRFKLEKLEFKIEMKLKTCTMLASKDEMKSFECKLTQYNPFTKGNNDRCNSNDKFLALLLLLCFLLGLLLYWLCFSCGIGNFVPFFGMDVFIFIIIFTCTMARICMGYNNNNNNNNGNNGNNDDNNNDDSKAQALDERSTTTTTSSKNKNNYSNTNWHWLETAMDEIHKGKQEEQKENEEEKEKEREKEKENENEKEQEKEHQQEKNKPSMKIDDDDEEEISPLLIKFNSFKGK